MSTVNLAALGESPRWDKTFKTIGGLVGAAVMACLIILVVLAFQNHDLAKGEKALTSDESVILANEVTLLNNLNTTITAHSQTLAALSVQENQLKTIENAIHQEITSGHTSTVNLLGQLSVIVTQTKVLLTTIDAEENAGGSVLKEFRSDVVLLENTQKVIQAELAAICTSVHCSTQAG